MASAQTKIGKVNKVFIDSSVLIAAAISSQGYARDLIRKSLRGEVEVIISDLVIEETQRNLENYDSYIFFSGDGDFATLYKRLIEAKKQVIVVYAPEHIGREIWEIQRGLFKVNIQNMGF